MPVITESNKASLALKWACCEMDRRYKVMETAKVRHIKGFNKFWNTHLKKGKIFSKIRLALINEAFTVYCHRYR